MMAAVFDTCIVIDYLNGIKQAAETFEQWHETPAISMITWMEVMVGAQKQGVACEAKTRQFLARFVQLPVDDAVAERAVVIRNQWHIKLPDAIIAATAQTNNRLLVTRNTKDFTDGQGVVIPYRLDH